jgi:hypothetical protein
MLKLIQRELGQFTLNESGAGFFGKGHSSMISDHPLAVGMSPAVQNPRNAVQNARFSRDRDLRSRVTVRPDPSCGGKGGMGPAERPPHSDNTREPKTTSAEVLEALHRATGLPIVADFFTRLYAPGEVSVEDQPLFETLNQLADAMHLRWHKEEEWLQVRSASFYDDRLKEVPNRLLSRWAASRGQREGLPLEELIEIAQLSDTQLDANSVAEGAKQCWGLEEWDLPQSRMLRPQLRFLATMTSNQRQAATSLSGLASRQLTLRQQQQFIALSGAVVQSLEKLADMRLCVDYSLPGWWLWYSPEEVVDPASPAYGPPRVRERSREAALAAARRLDPQAEEAQIVASKRDLVVLYVRHAPNELHFQRINRGGTWGFGRSTGKQ